MGLFYVSWLLFRYHALRNLPDYGFRYNYFISVGYAALLFWFFRTYNAWLLGYTRVRALVFGQFVSQFFAVVLLYFVVIVSWNHYQAPWVFPRKKSITAHLNLRLSKIIIKRFL